MRPHVSSQSPKVRASRHRPLRSSAPRPRISWQRPANASNPGRARRRAARHVLSHSLQRHPSSRHLPSSRARRAWLTCAAKALQRSSPNGNRRPCHRSVPCSRLQVHRKNAAPRRIRRQRRLHFHSRRLSRHNAHLCRRRRPFQPPFPPRPPRQPTCTCLRPRRWVSPGRRRRARWSSCRHPR